MTTFGVTTKAWQQAKANKGQQNSVLFLSEKTPTKTYHIKMKILILVAC